MNWLIFALILGLSVTAKAEVTSPVGVSLLSFGRGLSVGFPGEEGVVRGFRFGLLGARNKDVAGLDIGVLPHVSTRRFTGIGVNVLVNRVYGPATITGLQLAGLMNLDYQGTVLGLQAAGLVNRFVGPGTVVGIQFAGLQNLAPQSNIYGAQVALINRAKRVVGLQVGLVNIAENLYGMQLGLVNVNKSGPLKFFPILNVGF